MPRESDADKRDELARTLKALAQPHRLHMIEALGASALTILGLTNLTGLAQPTTSHHVRILIDVGLVTTDKEGVWVWVRLVPGALDRVAEALAGVR